MECEVKVEAVEMVALVQKEIKVKFAEEEEEVKHEEGEQEDEVKLEEGQNDEDVEEEQDSEVEMLVKQPCPVLPCFVAVPFGHP